MSIFYFCILLERGYTSIDNATDGGPNGPCFGLFVGECMENIHDFMACIFMAVAESAQNKRNLGT